MYKKKKLLWMVVFVICIGALISCAGGPRSAQTAVMIEGAHAADEAFSKNDIDAYAAYFTDDFIHDNVTGEPSPKEDFVEMVAGFFSSFPGVKNYQKDLLPYKNYLVFDECTFDIPIAGTDHVITVFHMDIVEMEGEKLKVKMTFGDEATFPVAFGQIEPPVPTPKPASFALPNSQPTGLKARKAQEEFQERWNSHDLSSLASMIRSDAEVLVSSLFDPVDRSSYIGWQEMMFEMFPDIKMTTIRILDGDGWAASEVMLEGTNSGSYPGGQTSTGKQIELRAGYLTRFDDDGQVTSLKLFIDSMKILEQLGLEPTPKITG